MGLRLQNLVGVLRGGLARVLGVFHMPQGATATSAYSIVTMISLSDLGRETPPFETVTELARQFNRRAGTDVLARFNLYLSMAQLSGNRRLRIQLQEKLTERVLSRSRLKEIKKTFKKRGLYDKWVLLHRAQLLVGVKLLALYGHTEGGNCLQSVNDWAAIGELALAITSSYGPGLSEPDRPTRTVVAQVAAGMELYQLPHIEHGLVRTRMLLGPILDDYVAGLTSENSPPPFERIFTLLNGINFRDFLDITMYLAIEQGPMLPDVLRAEAMTYVDTAQPKRYVSGRIMKAWAGQLSVNYEDVKELVEGTERDAAFFYDLTMFRRFPFWRTDDRRYFCIDATFLAERLSSFGFYWVVINGLEDQTLRQRFQEVWGQLVQEYVRRLIGELAVDGPGVFVRNPTYADDDTEVFDAAVVLDDCLIAIEIKSSVVPIHQKYAGDPGPFFEGLSAKFGGGQSAAVEQLLRNLGGVFALAEPRVAPSIPTAAIKEVFPIAVVHEPILRFGPAAQAVVTDFASGLSDLTLRKDLHVHPVQLVEIEDLERLESHLRDKDFTLLECLRAKVLEDPGHSMGLWQFVATRYLPARGLTPKPNTRIAAVFDWLKQAALWRIYRGDYCDPALGTRGQPSKRALICARPLGGDDLLSDEVVVFSEYANVSDAYSAIAELQADGYPRQTISADGFVCAVVDEFGYVLERPQAGDGTPG